MMAAPSSTPSPSPELADGPVLTLINKRIRSLRKKLNRITQMEDSLSQGKSLNKEQEETLKTKPSVLASIDELEKLKAPLSLALIQELQQKDQTALIQKDDYAPPPTPVIDNNDVVVEDLISVVYLGSLFDVKHPSQFASMVVARETERQSCLSFDYVTDEVTDSDVLLGEPDLDLIATMGGLLSSRPSNSSLPHKNALERCVEHAKLWLANSDQPIGPDNTVTYAGLREKLKKIMASDFLTTKPELKDPVEVAAAAGNYAHFQVPLHGNVVPVQVEGSAAQYELKDDPSNYQGNKVDNNQSSPTEDVNKDELATDNQPEAASSQVEHFKPQADVEQNETNADFKEQDYHRRTYQNPRGGRGGARRGYSNGRGGRSGSRGGGPYQNGRNQYYDQPGNYYPRNYYNNRGRSGRGGGGYSYNHHGGAAQPGFGSSSGDVGIAS